MLALSAHFQRLKSMECMKSCYIVCRRRLTLPVGMPNSLLPLPKPLHTMPSNRKGNGSAGTSGPAIGSRCIKDGIIGNQGG